MDVIHTWVTGYVSDDVRRALLSAAHQARITPALYIGAILSKAVANGVPKVQGGNNSRLEG